MYLIAEMACLFGEIAALRHDIRQLQELRCDLKDSAGLRAELAELKQDLTATKRLVRLSGHHLSMRICMPVTAHSCHPAGFVCCIARALLMCTCMSLLLRHVAPASNEEQLLGLQ